DSAASNTFPMDVQWAGKRDPTVSVLMTRRLVGVARAIYTTSRSSSTETEHGSRKASTTCCMNGRATDVTPIVDKYVKPRSRTRGVNENWEPAWATYSSAFRVSRYRRAAARVSPLRVATSVIVSAGRSLEKDLITAKARSTPCTNWRSVRDASRDGDG